AAWTTVAAVSSAITAAIKRKLDFIQHSPRLVLRIVAGRRGGFTSRRGARERERILAPAALKDYSTRARLLSMASIVIRILDMALKRKLRRRAAQHGRSTEDEARVTPEAALAENTPAPTNLFDAIRRHVDPVGGVNLRIPPRGSMRKPPTLNDA